VDIQAIRADFPILQRKINCCPMVYFDNAATTQKPRQVIEVMDDFYLNHNANVHRGVHTLSLEATDIYERSRETVGKFIGAKDPQSVVFTRGTTEAINLVAYSWGLSNLGKGDEVLVSLMEHHSNIVPWEITGKIKGFKVKFANVKSDGSLDYDDFDAKFTNKTKIACLSHVSNVTGVINDVRRVGKLAHEHGALMLVDGAQSAPHFSVNIEDLDCDFFAFSGHKMLGPTGIGALYGKIELLRKMPPFQGGGEMIKEVAVDQVGGCSISWNDLPYKFEAGTPNICGAIGLAEAVRYLEKLGMNNVLAHEEELTAYAVEHIKEFSKVTLHGPTDPNKRCGIISFNVRGLSSHDVALLCDNYGIMIRSGYHCAQPLHQQVLKLESSDRASFYVYNTKEEIDRFVEVLKEMEQL
jgi:cysteine desulfurase/selenocysteine lyase